MLDFINNAIICAHFRSVITFLHCFMSSHVNNFARVILLCFSISFIFVVGTRERINAQAKKEMFISKGGWLSI